MLKDDVTDDILGFSIDLDNYGEKNVNYSVDEVKSNVSADAEDDNEVVENTSKSIVITPEKLETFPHEESLEEKFTVPKVQEIFEAAKCQESLIENLPNVPNTDEFFDDQNSVDEDIEARLCKLKFFRKTWCSQRPVTKLNQRK